MKRFLMIFGILFCTTVFAHTIEWYVGDTLLSTTTCESGDNITPPTVPEKFGYHFRKWAAYTPIEYLESTGTQWIDTRYIPNNNSGLDVDVYSVRSNEPKFALATSELSGKTYSFGAGSFSGNAYVGMLVYNGQSGDNSYVHDVYGNGTGRYTISINKRQYSIQASNGSVISGTFPNETFSLTENVYLFSRNYKGVTQPTICRIYSCKLYDNDVLVRDFIPVLDLDGTPCMYDKVENKFYYNQGTGQFIAGPVVNE